MCTDRSSPVLLIKLGSNNFCSDQQKGAQKYHTGYFLGQICPIAYNKYYLYDNSEASGQSRTLIGSKNKQTPKQIPVPCIHIHVSEAAQQGGMKKIDFED